MRLPKICLMLSIVLVASTTVTAQRGAIEILMDDVPRSTEDNLEFPAPENIEIKVLDSETSNKRIEVKKWAFTRVQSGLPWGI